MFIQAINKDFIIRCLLILCLSSILFLSLSCRALVGGTRSGVVIPRRAQIRSSSAVVAADLKEVSRGERLDILGSEKNDNDLWFYVRTTDAESIEGWIEAQNILSAEMFERSQELALEDKEISTQATGQLRSRTNLRLTPDRNGTDNIMFKLDSGSRFDIVGWKIVPEPKTGEAADSDDTPRSGNVRQKGVSSRARDDNAAGDENALWYKVRFEPASCVAPTGWVYGKQVELAVPSDIIFYRTGREFVAWQQLDSDATEQAEGSRAGSAASEANPSSWVILEKGSSKNKRQVNDPDFDRIYVLGYNSRAQEHYTAYRSQNLKGRLPLRVFEEVGQKMFSVNVQADNGSIKEMRYKIKRDEKGHLRVEAVK